MSETIVKRIKIEGFKSIKSLDLTLDNLNILIGANGSGKSNFIAAFKFLNQIVNKNLQYFVAKSGGVDRFLHFGQKNTEQISLYVEFVSQDLTTNIYELTLEPTVSGNFIFANEKIRFDRQDASFPFEQSLGSGHSESKLEYYPFYTSHMIAQMQKWIIYHFHNTSETAKLKQKINIDDNRFLRPDASNLAAYLYLLRETEKPYYNNIVNTIQLVAPFFEDFDLHPDRLNENKIKLELRQKGSDAYFDSHSLSDGTLRFICLATLLMQPEKNMPQAILLDEPELGLHPYAIKLLADLLEIAAKHTQIIVSTQSVTLVDEFEPENLIVVESHRGESIFKKLYTDKIEHWLEDYSLGELWEKNVIGGRPTL